MDFSTLNNFNMNVDFRCLIHNEDIYETELKVGIRIIFL